MDFCPSEEKVFHFWKWILSVHTGLCRERLWDYWKITFLQIHESSKLALLQSSLCSHDLINGNYLQACTIKKTEAWKVKLQNDFLCFNELCFQKGEKLDSQILFFFFFFCWWQIFLLHSCMTEIDLFIWRDCDCAILALPLKQRLLLFLNVSE